MKETFIIRTEWYNSISKLSLEEQGIILKNLFSFHAGNEQNLDLSTLSLQLVWGLIEPNLKRNIENYDRRCETSAKNGLLGGRPPKKQEPKKPNNKPNYPIETLSDTDTGSDTDSEKSIYPTVEEVIEYFQKNDFSESHARKVFAYYADNDWKDSRGNKVKAWKQKMAANWFKEEYKTKQAPVKKMVNGVPYTQPTMQL